MSRARALSRLLGLAALGVVLAPTSARAQPLDVDGWLRRPGVKLLVVEFYATWCKPCMEAVPAWKALHDRYRKEGLRFVVVSTRDPGGTCASPGWTPDDVICDDEGFLADRFGANTLPAAYLWSWQGSLLSSGAHVDEVETAVERWMRDAPRVDVVAESLPRDVGISRSDLQDMVRADLRRSGKLAVVDDGGPREELRARFDASLALDAGERETCELGQELSPNSLVRAVITRSRRPRLQLQLLSAERGCLVAAGTTRWNPEQPSISVGEAVAALLAKLRTAQPQLPWASAARPPPAARPPASSTRFDGATPEPAEATLSVSATERGRPVEAEVWVDGRSLGLTPLELRLPPGPTRVELRTERARRIRELELAPREARSLEVDLTPEAEPAPEPAPRRRPEPEPAPRATRATPSPKPAPPERRDPEPRPGRFDSEITGELNLLLDSELAELGTALGVGYGLDLGSSLWLFGRLAVEVSRGEDQFGALAGMRGFLVDGRFNVYAGASLGLLPVPGEAFAVGPQLGARFILAGGLFLGAQVEAFVLPFAEDEGELLFTGGAQLGFFLD